MKPSSTALALLLAFIVSSGTIVEQKVRAVVSGATAGIKYPQLMTSELKDAQVVGTVLRRFETSVIISTNVANTLWHLVIISTIRQ